MTTNPLSYPTMILSALSIIVGIIAAYGLCTFQKLSKLPEIEARFPGLVNIESRVVIVTLTVLLPLRLILQDFHDCDEFNISLFGKPHELDYVLECLRTVLTSSALFLTHIEAMRLWLMYFRLRQMVSLQNEVWGSVITSNFWKLDFYLKYRGTIGNPKWIGKRVFCYWIVISLVLGYLNWTMYLQHYHVHMTVSILFYLFSLFLLLSPLVFIALLYRKVPKREQDNMMIDKEFRMTCFIVAFTFFGFISLLTLVILDHHESLHQFYFGLSYVFTCSAPMFVATIWIPRKLKTNETVRMMNFGRGPLVLKKGLFKDRRLNPDGTTTKSYIEELRNMLLDTEKMKAMARWMIRDFTLETFVAFVEVVQFKNRVIAVVQEQNPHFDADSVNRQKYKLYEHCPKSSIVFNGGGENNNNNNNVNLEAVIEEMKEEIVVEMAQIEERENDDAENMNMNGNEENQKVAPKVSPNEVGINNITPMGIVANNNEVKQSEEVRPIVLAASDIQRFRSSAHLLLEKYMSSRSSFEINICDGMKQRYYVLDQQDYASLEPLDWISLYDPILKVLWSYMSQSYNRMIDYLHRVEQEELNMRGCRH